MKSHDIAIGLLLSLSLLVTLVSAKDCELRNNDDPGKELLKRINPLKGKIFSKSILGSDGKEKFEYKVGICTNPDKDQLDAGVIQLVKDKPTKHILGTFNDTSILGGENWIFLTYYGGEKFVSCNKTNKTTHILLVCDPSLTQEELTVLGDVSEEENSNCFYAFQMASSLACAEKESKLSGGSVFCILFFTVLGLYLLLGFIYQRLGNGAQGLEQIPNYEFWKEFGNLQADGCDFICRCGSRREANSYRGIDERLPRDDDRDDQLLTM